MHNDRKVIQDNFLKIFRVLQLNFFIVYVFFFITFFVGVGIFNDYLQNPISHKNEKKKAKILCGLVPISFGKKMHIYPFKSIEKRLCDVMDS